MKIISSTLLIIAILSISCQRHLMTDSGLYPKNFIASKNNHTTQLYTLHNQNGLELCVTNFGGRMVSLMVPGKNGDFYDVILGFDNIHTYMERPNVFGATIGRYANRIKNGHLVIDDVTYQLPQNNGMHCLHGGTEGWANKMMEVLDISTDQITFSFVSPDGESAFPGTVHGTVKYRLTSNNEVEISYSAISDKTTVINMSNHAFFNLNGDPEIGAEKHLLYVNASAITPIDSTSVPTGKIMGVENTPFDFRTEKRIGEKLDMPDLQLEYGNGYDHNWILDTKGRREKLAGSLYSEVSGIMMEMYTDEPGVQIYTANFLNGDFYGKDGKPYTRRCAVCLETQHFPDSPNHPEWPSTLLKEGEIFKSSTIYKFSVRNGV